METIFVEIFLPAINQSYDFVMPAHIPVGCFVNSLITAIKASVSGVMIDEEHPCLCDMTGKRPIPPEKTLTQCGIRDSARLMLL